MRLVFYTTEQCTLCEEAEQLLMQVPLEEPIPVDAIDIAQEAGLVDKYGERIPVLRRTDTGAELQWPFNMQDVLDFLK
ncbi:glutaredoxin family protein [Marinobacteraceae bacterium S3BR75-40.1]